MGKRRLLSGRASRLLARELGPRRLWPWTLPGAPALLERRWAELVEGTPAIPAEQHAAATGVKRIEEVIGCSLCGERTMQPLFHPRIRRRRRGRGHWTYHVVRCPRCGLLFRHPGIRPERLGDLYANTYSTFLAGHYGDEDRRRRYRLVLDAFDPAFRDGAGRRALDFGCGTGLFLDEALARGFDPYGVDLSPDSVEVARTRPSGRNAFHGAPSDVAEIAAGGFDLVTLWSVLAHLATPVEDLRMLRGLLRDDGLLLVLTVNGASLGLKARRSRWNGFTKNHLKVFSPATLPDLLRLAGFAAVVFRPMAHDDVEAGTSRLPPRTQRRLRRAVAAGNRGNMMRAVAFADADGPARWGLEDGAIAL